MAEILKEWLTERLQRPIVWEAQEFGVMMQSGYIIAGVLLSYHVINEEQYFLIRESNAYGDIKNNWKYLLEWLGQIDVFVNENELKNIFEGKGCTLLRLFYQLFLHLDKRDRTNFIKREQKMVSNLVDKLEKRFKIDKVHEGEEPVSDDLARPLLNERHFIEWQRKKQAQVKETYDYIRHKYLKMLAKIEESKTPPNLAVPKNLKLAPKEKKDMEAFELRYPCKFENYSYEQLISMDEAAAEKKEPIVDTEWAKNYMENLYSRLNKKSDSEEFQKQVRNVISGSLWDLSVAGEENKLDNELAKKVMKLSQFEKQMCTQIMETKQQARNLAKNRIIAEKEFAEQREQQFHQFLDNVKEQIHLEEVEIDFEKNRQEMLHKRLYAEKMKRKRQHYYEICYETVLSLVDYATKYAYYFRLLGEEIPDHFIHEWKNLFFKKQPIFDIYEPMEDLIKEQGLEEEPIQDEEEVVRLELDRQEALNDEEFIEYHNYWYPWNLEMLIPNFKPTSEERKYEALGLRILGHVVYTLLEIKYPYPPPRPPADLPEFVSKALVRGLPDKSIALAMQALLNYHKIFVVRLECAINFCLRNFKNEMIGCTDIELSFDKFVSASREEEDKDFIKALKAEDEFYSKSSDVNYTAIAGPSPPNTKQTQTPKTLPEEDIRLSPAAALGKYAYEALSFGESLTDHLIAAMIAEYIKDQKGIRGFVIINYPNSYREAAILEETFSGREPPPEEIIADRDDIYLEESITKHRKKEKDQYKEIRVSRLVIDPHKKRKETPFESYFSAYLKLKESDDILQELVIWDLDEDNSDLIDRFYAALGINYSMYHEVIEKEFLSQLCKYVIGDLTLPLKSGSELFGVDVLNNLEFPSTDDKRMKNKIVKPELSTMGKSREKLRRLSKLVQSKTAVSNMEFEMAKQDSLIEITHTEPTVAAEEITGEHDEHDNVTSTTSSDESKILAGNEEWDYGEIPISEIIGVALATCWEEIEKIYIHDIQQMLFAKRMQMNCLIPYTRFIKDKMEQIITLPSYKQDLVSRFQNEYNEFEDDWRDVNLSKNEWHCRIKELQNKLYHICDERKLFAEQQRQALIVENWAMEELTTMVNTFISMMQTEVNRFYLTYQALHDFYFTMLKKLPNTDRIGSKELTKINREADDGGKKEDKVFRQLKLAFLDLQLKNININFNNNPFNMIIENNVKYALKIIKDSNDSYRSLISKEYSEIAKIVPTVKKKEDTLSDIEEISAEETFKINALKCIEEWIMGINGEMFRASQRIVALQYKCYHDMKLFNDQISKAFTDVQNDINNYYMNEIKSVDRLCKYLQMAVENGRKIPESLILEHDTFIIDPNLLQFAPPEPPQDAGEVTEQVNVMEFRICQLVRLRSQFKIVAPTGITLQQAFIYLLQDFIFFGKESCEGALVPELWRRLDPEQVPKFVNLLYGETAYVDWRDFLIYCLGIRFPTVEELLDMRHRFRCIDHGSTELISRDDFLEQELWFEAEFDPEDKHAQLRKTLIKHFLFELFEVSKNMSNYSAFLLAFCKSIDTIEGFSKALAVATGKKTCYIMEDCEEVVCNMIKLKKYRDECLACAHKCTAQFLDIVIHNVVKICEGTTLTDVPYTEEPTSEGNKLKGRKSKMSKKEMMSQSARSAKSQKSSAMSQSKMAHSAVELKTTYICPPCEEEPPAVEEKPAEKEEVEEEQKSEVRVDPNLAYTVSQDVIWNVLKICLPWHFTLIPEEKVTPFVGQVTETMKRLEVNTDNGDIYVCMFVADPHVCRILHRVKKFTALNLVEEVQKVCV